MTNEESPSQEFDSPWKEALEKYFEEFILFFFPYIHADIDWLIALPPLLEEEFKAEIIQMEEEKMPYMTSIERLGRMATAREMVLKAIEIKFQTIPEDMKSVVENIRASETLESLLGLAITSENINAFRKAVNEAHGI